MRELIQSLVAVRVSTDSTALRRANKEIEQGRFVARYEAGGAHGTQIRKDIGRTLPGERTCINTPEGLRVLERILGAFSEFDGWYGYCQSMNMVAAHLLVVMTLEEEE